MSATMDSLNLWYRSEVRRRILKVWARIVTVRATMSLVAAWCLITWSAFGFRPRAWAASIGVLLLLETFSKILTAYYTAKMNAARKEQ